MFAGEAAKGGQKGQVRAEIKAQAGGAEAAPFVQAKGGVHMACEHEGRRDFLRRMMHAPEWFQYPGLRHATDVPRLRRAARVAIVITQD